VLHLETTSILKIDCKASRTEFPNFPQLFPQRKFSKFSTIFSATKEQDPTGNRTLRQS